MDPINIRNQINAIRQQEITRTTAEMNLNMSPDEVARRYPLFRRTMNNPTEDKKINEFETSNTSFATN